MPSPRPTVVTSARSSNTVPVSSIRRYGVSTLVPLHQLVTSSSLGLPRSSGMTHPSLLQLLVTRLRIHGSGRTTADGGGDRPASAARSDAPRRGALPARLAAARSAARHVRRHRRVRGRDDGGGARGAARRRRLVGGGDAGR